MSLDFIFCYLVELTHDLKIFFSIGAYLTYYVVLVSAIVQQSELLINTHISTLRFSPHIDHCRVQFPELYSRSLLATYFIYSTIYMSSQISQFILSPHWCHFFFRGGVVLRGVSVKAIMLSLNTVVIFFSNLYLVLFFLFFF